MTAFSEHQTLDLKTVASVYRLSFPMPERWRIRNVRLVVQFTNSVTLLKGKSQLVVSVNDHPVGQALLDTAEPNGTLDVAIPAVLLNPGYNRIDFSVAQHYLEQCEQWDAPNLWTNLQLDRSYILFQYDEEPLPLKLSEAAAFIFDSKTFPHGRVHIVADRSTSEMAGIAGIVASGVSQRFDYRKVEFSASQDIREGVDNIVVGEKNFVNKVLGARQRRIEVRGAMLKIMHIPLVPKKPRDPLWDTRRGVLVITGGTAAEVRRAAQAVAHIAFPFPAADETLVNTLELPAAPPYVGKRTIEGGKAYTLKELSFLTHTFRKVNPVAAEFEFAIPNDTLVHPNRYASLNLNYVYGPGLKAASSLTVAVNETTSRVIQLNKDGGESLENYVITLPSYLFRPGRNKIVFTSYLVPNNGMCEMFMPDSYYLTLYDNSTMTFPEMPHLVRLPNLELFANDGFPFTRMPDGRESVIFLPGSDDDSMAAAFNMIGFMTQRSGYPLFEIEVKLGVPGEEDKDLILIGKLDSIPDDLASLAPIKISNESRVSFPLQKKQRKDVSFIKSEQVSLVDGSAGFVMGLESPYKNGRSVLVLSGADTGTVAKLSRALLEPAVYANIKGDLAFINLKGGPATEVVAIDTGNYYWTGENGRINFLTCFFNRYQDAVFILSVIGALLLGLILFFFLARLRRRRLALAENSPDASG